MLEGGDLDSGRRHVHLFAYTCDLRLVVFDVGFLSSPQYLFFGDQIDDHGPLPFGRLRPGLKRRHVLRQRNHLVTEAFGFNIMGLQRDQLLEDVGLAAQVQRMFLPRHRPSIAGLEIAGMMQPARVVGGDFYGYIPVDAHRMQVVVADVSGKGVSAALLMSATAAALQFQSNQGPDVQQTIARLNSGIHAVSDGEHYVTVVLAEIDTSARSLRYMNCGHNPALLLRRKTGQVETLDSSCPPVGMFEQELCELSRLEIDTGDVLVFYTDGLTEAANRLEEEFGLQRLTSIVQETSSLSAEEIMRAISLQTSEFCQDNGFSDDVTILVVKCEFGKSPE